MASVPVFVGLDYHDREIQVCVMDQAGKVLMNRKVGNRVADVVRFVSIYGTPRGVAIEACCGAADLGEKLQQLEWPVQLAHPGFVKRMKQNPDKHDLGDAQLLADLVRVGYLPKVWLAPAELRRLRRLVRYREQLVAARRDTKLRIRALLRENRIRTPEMINPWTQAYFKWLEDLPELHEDDRWLLEQHVTNHHELTEKIRDIEQRLADRTADDLVVQKLLSFYGVGLITAVTMRAEIGQFDRFRTGKQLARFCGVSPRNASSGDRQADAGMIKAGNRHLRQKVIELAHRLINRMDGEWSEFAVRLLRKGKRKNVVVAAVANRWMRRLYYQMLATNLAA